MDGKETLRAFVAIKLSGRAAGELARIRKRLVDSGVGAKWVKPENIHLTLRFLGDIPVGSVAPVLSCMEAAADAVPHINFLIRGLGVFPDIRRARVLWAGLDDERGILSNLNTRLESELDKIGFTPENRRFTPHLTLGRIKKPVDPGVLAGALKETGVFSPVPFTARRIYLIKSRLTKNGPVYTAAGYARLDG